MLGTKINPQYLIGSFGDVVVSVEMFFFVVISF